MNVRLLLPGLLVGSVMGLGAYTFIYAKGYSYLTNNPAACANCHAMREYYDGWIKGSHRSVATCNDCHTPHNFIGKYAVKATNGFFHSLYFTTGNYPDNIQIKGYNRRVTEGTCKYCHEAITHDIVGGQEMSCVRCHSSVGHYHFAAETRAPSEFKKGSEPWQSETTAAAAY
jgi:cytochrome c nitrite reductase small subunit